MDGEVHFDQKNMNHMATGDLMKYRTFFTVPSIKHLFMSNFWFSSPPNTIAARLCDHAFPLCISQKWHDRRLSFQQKNGRKNDENRRKE